MRLSSCLLAAALVLLPLAGCEGGPAPRKSGAAADEKRNAATVHMQLGQRYMETGKYEYAMEKLLKSLEYDPNFVDAHTVIAVLYERLGDSKRAEQHYRRAAELAPKDGNVNNNYGTFLCKGGQYEESAKYFARAIDDPFYKTPDVAYANSGSCQKHAGHADLAEAAFRRAVELNPNSGDSLFQLASLLYTKDDFFHARAYIQRYESLTQPSAEALLLGYDIEQKMGNTTGAQDYARRLRQQFPDSEQARKLDSSNPS